MTKNRGKAEDGGTTLENFGERKLQKIFADDKNPLVVKVGELIEKKASIEDIVRAAKIAAEQSRSQMKKPDNTFVPWCVLSLNMQTLLNSLHPAFEKIAETGKWWVEGIGWCEEHHGASSCSSPEDR